MAAAELGELGELAELVVRLVGGLPSTVCSTPQSRPLLPVIPNGVARECRTASSPARPSGCPWTPTPAQPCRTGAPSRPRGARSPSSSTRREVKGAAAMVEELGVVLAVLLAVAKVGASAWVEPLEEVE